MHFRKMNIQCSSIILSLFIHRNLDFKHSLDIEMILENGRIERFKD